MTQNHFMQSAQKSMQKGAEKLLFSQVLTQKTLGH